VIFWNGQYTKAGGMTAYLLTDRVVSSHFVSIDLPPNIEAAVMLSWRHDGYVAHMS
jgi:hypothetical protein